MSGVDDVNNPRIESERSTVVVDIKRRLSAHVQSRLAVVANNVDPGACAVLTADGSGHQEDVGETVRDSPSRVQDRTCIKSAKCCESPQQSTCENAADNVVEKNGGGGNQSVTPSGSFMAGSLVLSNSILDEVLNEKKLALLQSPEVIKFLRECQNKS